jgi:hypothetical protein
VWLTSCVLRCGYWELGQAGEFTLVSRRPTHPPPPPTPKHIPFPPPTPTHPRAAGPNHRRGVHLPDRQRQRAGGEAALMGHGGRGDVPQHDKVLFPGCRRGCVPANAGSSGGRHRWLRSLVVHGAAVQSLHCAADARFRLASSSLCPASCAHSACVHSHADPCSARAQPFWCTTSQIGPPSPPSSPG